MATDEQITEAAAPEPKATPVKKPDTKPAPKPIEPKPKPAPAPRFVSPQEAGFQPVEPTPAPEYISPEEAGFKPAGEEEEKKSFFRKLKFW